MTQTTTLAKPPGFRDPGLPMHKPPPSRKANLPPSFYTQEKRRSFCCRCCCCLFVFMVLLVLFFVSSGGFFYLWYEPRVPGFRLKSFQVNKFNVTNTPDGPTLESQVSVSIEFKNTNKNIKLVYDRIAMYLDSDVLGSGGVNMGQVTVPGFIQEQNNVTVVKFALKGNQILDDSNAKRLKDQFRAKSLLMTVGVRTGIGMVLAGFNTGTVGINVICGASTLKQIQDGVMPTCRVFVLRVLNIY